MINTDGHAAYPPAVAQLKAEGALASTPLLHSWFVQRGDGLILRTLSPNFALTPKLQHYQIVYERASSGIRVSMPCLRLRQARNDAN